MSVSPVFSLFQGTRVHYQRIEGREEQIAKMRTWIQDVIRRPAPTPEAASMAHQTHSHPIIGNVHLGNSRAFASSTHFVFRIAYKFSTRLVVYANQDKFDVVITVCPKRDLAVDYPELFDASQAEIRRDFQDNRVEWLYVGRTVDDHPMSWHSLVHDCTRMDSSDAQKEFSHISDMTLGEYVALNESKALQLAQISPQEWFGPVFAQLDGAVFGDKKILVHCRAGISRSATLLAAYLIRRFGCTADEALAFLQRQRACVNSQFRDELKDYECQLSL